MSEHGPEVNKMLDRLLNGPIQPDGSRLEGYKLRNFHAWWGDDPADPESLAAAINQALAQADQNDFLTRAHNGG